MRRKSEAGSQKSESPKVSRKPKVESQKSENQEVPKAEGQKRKAVSKPVQRSSFEDTENKSAFDPPAGGQAFEIKETLTTDHSPLTNMEVHHHPEVEKKGFKAYILEGLMIFIAVMMGFFAESYREHLSDRSKEREYVINIKKDLIADTANLGIWIPSLYKKIYGYDTLMSCLEASAPIKNGSDMYFYARFSTRATVFEPNDNTILEMKSSGNLRLIRNRDVINSLMNFEKLINQSTNLFNLDRNELMLTYPLLGQLFDSRVFNKMVVLKKGEDFSEKSYAGGFKNSLTKPPGNPQLRSNNEDAINLLVFYLHQRKSTSIGEIRQLREQEKRAEELIKLINKEYTLNE